MVLPGSVLTVKGGTIENHTFDGGIIAYAIDGRTNGGQGDVTVNVEGGTITSKRQAIRIFANSTTNTGALSISGGDITGRVIVQNANANANKAALSINGGTFNANGYKTDVLCVGGSNSATIDIDATVSGGTFNGEITGTNVMGFIAGGTYNKDVNDYCADGYAALPDLNGNYVVGEEPTATVNNLGATTIAGGKYSIYDGSSIKGTTATDPGMPLSFVMQFLADQDEDDMATSPYADWYGDFVLTFTGLESGSFSAEGCYLAGYYGSFGWVKVPVKGLLDTIEQGVRYPVMLGVGLGQKYDYICTGGEVSMRVLPHLQFFAM